MELAIALDAASGPATAILRDALSKMGVENARFWLIDYSMLEPESTSLMQLARAARDDKSEQAVERAKSFDPAKKRE